MVCGCSSVKFRRETSIDLSINDFIITCYLSMKPASLNTLAFLQKKGTIPTKEPIVVNCPTLDFTSATSLPSQSSSPLFLKLPQGNFYFGPVVNRRAEGSECIYIFSDGAFFQGSCKGGKFEGKGSLNKYGEDFGEKIFFYEGQWRNSKPHGQGREEILNSITYEGSFIQGKKCGQGVMTYIDGSQYRGEFYDNEVQGEGTYTTKVHQWKGSWKEGYLQGEGQQISMGVATDDDEDIDTRSLYKGGFLRGLKHGKGTYQWGKNFSEYSGTFSNGQLDGEGHFKLGEAQYRGRWKKGVEVSLESTIQFRRIKDSQRVRPSV